MLALHSKLPQVGTTIFTTMSSLAITHKAINLGQGFPDFLMNKELIALVADAMQKGKNQYTHMAGYGLLRERIAEKYNMLYDGNINSETDITITPGGTYAIYTALTTILEKDDEVIVFEPCYDSYIPNIEINGAKAICISLQYPDYSIPWQEVKTKINNKTKAIIINSPHNPTGAVLTEEDIVALKEIVANTNIIIVSDEVYEHLVFDGMQHQSILRHTDLMERSFVCFSFGKTYHCTGWKIGYCIASAALMKEFRKVHQFNCFSCNTPQQYALAEYILHKNAYLEVGNIMQEKRDYLRELMKQTPFNCIPSHGSYFECYSYHFTNETDKELAVRLTKEFGVATIPVSAFYTNATDNKVLRFCFAKEKDTLEKAAKQLQKLK
ncbi:MAG: aminotransferase class I/II-fold pyridoxal phosphate-dependent enzyme [Bacteroidetes bacterium]|nr:aminotransferase class I/II-fold pyridoxal phosphate-dependent enzyme [Bacteroidota bacterium]MBS1648959.1 aminotransferase class I/II-fold pyridoxal phosphate-dependent enzyme [Bacteroidota bacterium]